ncbi:Fructose-2,6-bisphosphatase [Mortierella sp. NVP85]|nr:Fructose-2,6-bisphosphatase [Mortierella sp. NVP85]
MSINAGSRIACVMVGLPATGKTLISQKVARYLTWLGINTKIFNVGNYRRKLHGAHQLHGFFDPHNPQGERSRREAAVEALNDMIYWFEKHQGVVALYDATNSTRSRRTMLLAECKKQNIQVMFIESICEDEALVLHNIMSVKLSSPDYKDMDPEQAVEDFKARIVHYKEAYEPITEEELTYIKLINVGSQVIINHIQGYLQSRIVYYLMNLHIAPRSIFFSRHGESLYNVMGKLGGDSDLSARGKQYAKSLPRLIAASLGDSDQLTVWTSTMKRTIATAEHLKYPKLAWKALDELDAGVCDGMTYEEIEEKYPEDFANRDEDKFNYRYRGGESYRDVVLRLEPVIMELERQQNILIIGHQAILRCIYAYFMNQSHEKLPYIKIPLHTVIQLTPRAYACDEKRFKVDIGAVDTHRPKPKSSAVKTTAEPVAETLTETTIPPAAPEGAQRPTGDSEKDVATITTTSMSTTTFRDSAFQRNKSFNRLSTEAKDKANPVLENVKALQSALAEIAGDSHIHPASASPPNQIKTTGLVSSDSPTKELEGTTPPMSPLQIPSAVGSEPAQTPILEPSLSIKTKDLLTTPPMARLKADLNLAAEWQEGHEYEKTAGASPRDPIMSPGGRLLPKKKDNWHFPAQAWIDAAPQQINMRVPFYGRTVITNTDMSTTLSMAAPFRESVPRGDNNDGLWTDPCEETAAYSGVWKYKNLREQRIIEANGQARAPWIRKFNPQTNQFLSYDDQESLRLKVEYAKRKNLGGVRLWALNQDTLLNVLQEIRAHVDLDTTLLMVLASSFRSVLRAPVRPLVLPRRTLSPGVVLRTYTRATEAQGSVSPTNQDSIYSPLPLYCFKDLSERDMLLSEMRHHRVSWTIVGQYFGISLVDAFFEYIRVASKAIHHGWTPRMTAQDIEHYLGRSDWEP